MTKREREFLLRGINPLTGERLASTEPAVAATPAAAWVAEAKAARAQPQAAAPLPRVWSFHSTGVSNSGRDTVVFQSTMKNGGTFQATLPGDLVRALRSGTVVGLK
jgi:hypothetical protein